MGDHDVVRLRDAADRAYKGSSDGERILVASEEGDVVLLDSALEPVSQCSFSVAVDQFGAADSRSALTWDGGSHVVLPPNNDGINGPIMGVDGAPDPQDGAIAGVYDVVTGDALAPLVSDGYLPLPATAAFLPDGSALAVSLGGLESPPSFGQMAREPELSGIPRPVAR